MAGSWSGLVPSGRPRTRAMSAAATTCSLFTVSSSRGPYLGFPGTCLFLGLFLLVVDEWVFSPLKRRSDVRIPRNYTVILFLDSAIFLEYYFLLDPVSTSSQLSGTSQSAL